MSESSWIDQASESLAPFYQQPHRAYHGIKHIKALLNLQQTHQHLIHDHLAVTLAIWFHDAIYDSTRNDNEEQSALLVEQTLPAWECRTVRPVHRPVHRLFKPMAAHAKGHADLDAG